MNFLPEENKILFKKYYLRKLLTVFGVLIFSVVAVGIIILIPMYSLILSYKKDLSRELSVYLKKDAELANSAAALEIKKLNSRLDFVEKMSKAKGLNPVFKNIFDKKKRIGVIGTGNLGKRIIEQFKHAKFPVTYYDFSKFTSLQTSHKGALTSVSEIIEKNDIIVGATGKDFLKGVVLDKAKGKKYLVSASSADVEFYSMLNRAGFPSDSFETITLIFKRR